MIFDIGNFYYQWCVCNDNNLYPGKEAIRIWLRFEFSQYIVPLTFEGAEILAETLYGFAILSIIIAANVYTAKHKYRIARKNSSVNQKTDNLRTIMREISDWVEETSTIIVTGSGYGANAVYLG